ncbi:helix-turn-helix domain-containing protein [Desulfovibrio sp. OttesenSCG-928-M14]|nr:helix-turn-helix domain-containing protein [Desulfovibrio sp. OttesenSCG-928-M14]
MDKDLFDELLGSIKQAGGILRGEVPPSRCIAVEEQDVKAIREKLRLSQSEFANLIRVNVRTLQNWEQRRRRPTGPASALLKVVANAPEAALRALHGDC